MPTPNIRKASKKAISKLWNFSCKLSFDCKVDSIFVQLNLILVSIRSQQQRHRIESDNDAQLEVGSQQSPEIALFHLECFTHLCQSQAEARGSIPQRFISFVASNTVDGERVESETDAHREQ